MVRKLNVASPTPDNLKFWEFNPPENDVLINKFIKKDVIFLPVRKFGTIICMARKNHGSL